MTNNNGYSHADVGRVTFPMPQHIPMSNKNIISKNYIQKTQSSLRDRSYQEEDPDKRERHKSVWRSNSFQLSIRLYSRSIKTCNHISKKSFWRATLKQIFPKYSRSSINQSIKKLQHLSGIKKKLMNSSVSLASISHLISVQG